MTTAPAVTAVRPDDARDGLVVVDVDGTPTARIRVADALALDLHPGCPWTDDRAAAVTAAERVATARARGLERLARRGWSVAALAARLADDGYDRATAEVAARGLADDGLLDEPVACGDRADALARRGPRSVRSIAERLEAEGFPEQLAAEAAARAHAGRHDGIADDRGDASDPDVAAAIEVLHRSLGPAPRDVAPRDLRRAIDRAARRGFDVETVRIAAGRLGVELPLEE